MNDKATATLFDVNDITGNKTIAALAYLFFFLPLLACPKSDFGKFHANQSLMLLITSVVGNRVLHFIPVLRHFMPTVFGLVMLGFLIYGIVNTLQGRACKLPVIGEITLIK